MYTHSLIARYGFLARSRKFKTELLPILPGDPLVLKTDRGTEYGVAVSSPALIHEQSVLRDDNWLVIRNAMEKDTSDYMQLKEKKNVESFYIAEECIRNHQLEMHLVACEYLLGMEKAIFYFTANGRVDFRALVKDMAGRFRIRIELRQIGQLDVVRALSDAQHCGRELCCRSFLKAAETVSAYMVKMQKNTMDPSKLKGQCGRRMCCLSYEDPVYNILQKGMPNEGDIVRTDSIEGIVRSVNLIKQEVVILFQQGDKTDLITAKKEEIVAIKASHMGTAEKDDSVNDMADVAIGDKEADEIDE